MYDTASRRVGGETRYLDVCYGLGMDWGYGGGEAVHEVWWRQIGEGLFTVWAWVYLVCGMEGGGYSNKDSGRRGWFVCVMCVQEGRGGRFVYSFSG